jgi:hypothetical protein
MSRRRKGASFRLERSSGGGACVAGVTAAWTSPSNVSSAFFLIALASVRGMRTLQQETQCDASSCVISEKLLMLRKVFCEDYCGGRKS